jgi:thiol:disulfide interchange protein DsbD
MKTFNLLKPLFFFLFLITVVSASAQIYNPVQWKTSVEKISETKYNLIATATIDADWHIYSQFLEKGGPIPTGFFFTENENYTLSGKVKEDKGHTIQDATFNMEVKSFSKKANFQQIVEVKNSLKKIEAFVEFMVCRDTQCLPPTEVDLVFDLTKAKDIFKKKR